MIPHADIPVDDRGLLLGDGLFETMLALDGVLPHLAAHLDRLTAASRILSLPFERDEAERLCRAAAPAKGRFAVRLTLTAGSGGRGLDRPAEPITRLFATAAAAPETKTPAALHVSLVRRNEYSLTSRLKTLSYLDNVMARAEARSAGADEAVMLNTRGDLACAAAANLFWIKDERLFTPRLDCGALAGITRARLLAQHNVEEVAAGIEALETADAIFLTNSLIGVREVSRLEDRVFAPHPLLKGLL